MFLQIIHKSFFLLIIIIMLRHSMTFVNILDFMLLGSVAHNSFEVGSDFVMLVGNTIIVKHLNFTDFFVIDNSMQNVLIRNTAGMSENENSYAHRSGFV